VNGTFVVRKGELVADATPEGAQYAEHAEASSRTIRLECLTDLPVMTEGILDVEDLALQRRLVELESPRQSNMLTFATRATIFARSWLGRRHARDEFRFNLLADASPCSAEG